MRYQSIVHSWIRHQYQCLDRLLAEDDHFQLRKRVVRSYVAMLTRRGWELNTQGRYKHVLLHPKRDFVIKLSPYKSYRGGNYSVDLPCFVPYIYLDNVRVLGIQPRVSLEDKFDATEDILQQLGELSRLPDPSYSYDVHVNNCGWLRGQPVCFDPIHLAFYPTSR